tara:strand:- start:3018 stop:3668 length:651 start_codon:yes stop_codon:yes gene_type:complete
MAEVKEYGYYIEGNKIAIVQKDISFDNDINSRNYGPDSDRILWKSPLESITDGIEIQYSYVPEYRINDASDTQAITGYDEDGTGLLKLTGSTLSTDSSITHIVVEGLDNFNGLHKIKTLNASYYILETKYSGAAVTNAGTMSIDVSVLQDESFEIDLPTYLQKALIYYIKSKFFEDLGDLEKREYFETLFLEQVERHNNAKIPGFRVMSAGSNAIR